MITKCECEKCGRHIEFDAAQLERSGETSHRILGQSIDCPHCQQRTVLYIPRHVTAAALPAPAKVYRTEPCPDCEKTISTRALMCPHCGSARGVRFLIVWQIFCYVGLSGAVFASAWIIISTMWHEALKAWQ